MFSAQRQSSAAVLRLLERLVRRIEMNDRNGNPIVSPLDTLEEAATREREQHDATVAMVIGCDCEHYLTRCDDPSEAYRPVCSPDSGLPDIRCCDFTRLSLAQVHFIELVMNKSRDKDNAFLLSIGQSEKVNREIFRLLPEELYSPRGEQNPFGLGPLLDPSEVKDDPELRRLLIEQIMSSYEPVVQTLES